MLKRGTVWLLVGAIALSGGVLLLESQRGKSQATDEATDEATDSLQSDSPQSDTMQGEGEILFPFAEEDVESLTIKRPEGDIAFTKSADGTWQMTSPTAAPAEAGAIAFLLSQLTSRSTHTLSVEQSTLADFGLTNPTGTIALVANGNPYELKVGNADFTGNQRYVEATDTPTAETAKNSSEAEPGNSVKIHVVSDNIDNAVNRPTPEWLAPNEATPDRQPEAVQPEEAPSNTNTPNSPAESPGTD